MDNNTRVAYAVLRDRHCLSIQNGWIDDDGNVFLIYSRKDLQNILGLSDKPVTKIMNNLNDKYNLINETRLGQGLKNKIYIMELSEEIFKIGENTFFESEKLRLNNRNLSDSKNGVSANHSLYSKTYDINTQSINPEVIETIDENIEYEKLIQQVNKNRLDEHIVLMLDTIMSKSDNIRIARQDIPKEVVKSRFLKISCEHMLELVRCGEINCIVVKDFSRFALDAMESGYFIEQVFPLYGVRFIAVSDRFDSDDYKDGTGGMDVAFKFLIHEYYSKDLSKKIKSSLHVKMKNGEHIVAGAVYGYRKNDCGKWEPDPPAAEIVREIFDMALYSNTTAQIRDKLFADRRLAPREYEYRNKGKHITPTFNWSTRQIWRILTNEQYTGSYVAGKQETTCIGGKSLTVHDKSRWIVIVAPKSQAK